jgi:WD40 repeat protein
MEKRGEGRAEGGVVPRAAGDAVTRADGTPETVASTLASEAIGGDESGVSPRAISARAHTIDDFTSSVAARPADGGGDLPIVDPGRYEFLGEIGRGGLGRVLKAMDRRLHRVVALKEMLEEGGSTLRFVREAIATAGLEHPSIIPVYDAGRWPTGRPFYSMKLVSSRSLASAIAELPTLDERLALLPNVVAIADAMAYAHSKGLIHRDLKPANVLVGSFGETVIIDWGLAKNLQSEAPVLGVPDVPVAGCPEGVTVAGAVLGTPAYMPPEQAAGRVVDERADVYAVGAILYQVLAGSPPYDSTKPDIMMRVLAGDPIPLRDRQPGVAPDLLTIVSKAMARDPRDRYPSAKELADDLRRFQTGQLVTSHAYSTWQLLTRWVHRYRLVVALSATLLAALAVVGVASVTRVIRARVIAEEATRTAESRANALLLMQARALLEVDPTATLAVLKTYPVTASDWEGVSSLASDAWSRGVARHVWRSDGENTHVLVSPDGRTIAAAGAEKVVHLWDATTGSERRLPGPEGEATWLCGSGDGRLIASAGIQDKRIWVWDIATGERHALVGHEDTVRSLVMSDSGVLVSVSRDKTIRVWNVASGEGRVLVRYDDLSDVGRSAISRDGRLLAYGGLKRVHLIDIDSGAEMALDEHEAGTGGLVFSEDGKTLASGGMDASARVWELATGKARVLRAHRAWISHLALSPDARTLVTSAEQGTPMAWNLDTGEGRVLPASVGDVRAIAFSPDGHYLAIAGDDRMIRLWETHTLVLRVLRGHGAPVSAIAFSSDSRELVSASVDKTVRLWDIATGDLRTLALPEGDSDGFRFSSHGEFLALARYEGKRKNTMFIADTRTGELRALGDSTHPLPAGAALTPDGKPLSGAEDALRRYVTDAGDCGAQWRALDINGCAYSPDAKLAATGAFDKTVRVWDTATDAMRTLGEHDGTVFAVAFSPDGRTVASGGTDRTVRLWDLATGASRVFRGHENFVRDVAFSWDGTRVGSVGMDGTLRVWNRETGAVRVYGGSQIACQAVAFSRDDRFALVGERSGSIRMWDLATGRSRVVRRHGALVQPLAVSPDGKTVASAAEDGSVWLWDIDAIPAFSCDPGTLRGWMGSVTSAEVDAAGGVSTR